MNKSVKKIIKSIVISMATLIAGFALTMISFNLFDSLTANQMKLLFGIDIICLVSVGGIFLFLSENRQAKKKSKARFEKRHSKRIERHEAEMKNLSDIISNSHFAA